jgi:hypothetical protein
MSLFTDIGGYEGYRTEIYLDIKGIPSAQNITAPSYSRPQKLNTANQPFGSDVLCEHGVL